MAPPIATAFTNSDLESTPTSKKYGHNNNKIISSQKIACSTISSLLLNKAMSITADASLFDTVSVEKSHANQALVDLNKLYDLNGMHTNNGLVDLLRVPENCVESQSLFNNEHTFDTDEEIVPFGSKNDAGEFKWIDNKIVIESIEHADKCSDLRNEKKNEYGRKLTKENLMHQLARERANNDKYGSKIIINSKADPIAELSKKSSNLKEFNINNEMHNKMPTVVKSKVKVKTEYSKHKTKQADNINEIANRLGAKHYETPKHQNVLANSYYGKIESSTMRNSIFKSSIDGENVISLNCVNPVQIFPYKLTLKRIKSEISDSEEEIDVVSVNLNKNSSNNCNKICLQETSNNIIIIKKGGMKNNIFSAQAENSEVQVIKNELLNNSDKCSLLADILKTPMSFSSKNISATKRQHDTNDASSMITACAKKSLISNPPPSIVGSTNRMKYPIHFYSSIKDNSYAKESYKNKFMSSKVIKSNILSLSHHRRIIKGGASVPTNANSSCPKKKLIHNVIQKASAKKQNMSRKPTSLIITQRAVKVASSDSIKSLWKNKQLKRKMNDRKIVKKNHSDYLIIADSEESSIEDNENEESDSRSSTLSNFSSNHSSGWSSPLEYSSGSEFIDKSSNVVSTFDFNVLNEKLSKKVNPDKVESNDWALYSNINDYGFSDTCSSVSSEKLNCSNQDHSTTNNTTNNNSNTNSIANSQAGNSSFKRNRSQYTSGYSSDNNPAEKRAFHILSERQRRNDLKKLFETLRTNVPNLSDKQKASKLTILKAAVDFLADVSAKQIKLSSVYDKEKQRHLQLIQNLKVLQANMK